MSYSVLDFLRPRPLDPVPLTLARFEPPLELDREAARLVVPLDPVLDWPVHAINQTLSYTSTIQSRREYADHY